MSVAAPIGDDLARSLITGLGADCAAAASLARVVILSQAGWIDLRRIDGYQPSSLARAAADFTSRGWLISSKSGLAVGANHIPAGVPAFLEGAAAMRGSMPDDARASAVVTMPVAPSAIARALPTTGISHASLMTTQQALEQIADAAVASLTVMTPFLNRDGLSLVLELFRRTPASLRRLIIRRVGSAHATVLAGRKDLIAADVIVLDYTLPAEVGFETFHAKVVLADQNIAYVGSANMTVYARYSMELGLMTENRAAKVIASVVRAVERIATPVDLR